MLLTDVNKEIPGNLLDLEVEVADEVQEQLRVLDQTLVTATTEVMRSRYWKGSLKQSRNSSGYLTRPSSQLKQT